MIERRQSIRVECELPSKYRNLDSSSPQKVTEAVVRNISRGGVCMRVDEFVPIQCQLYFYLSLPNQEPIEVRLTLAWVVELPNLGKYEMGARFVEMNAEQEDAVQSFQYRTLLDKMPDRSNLRKGLQKDPNQDPGVAA